MLPGGGPPPHIHRREAETFYVLEGEMTITIDGTDTVLGPMDSCTIPPDQVRKIENRTNHICKMLVIMPYPGGTRPE